MVNQLKVGTKIEGVAACMVGSKNEFVTIDTLVSMLDTIGFKGTSPGSTRTIIARDFKRRKWARRKVIGVEVHYYLVSQFFKDQTESIDRFIEMLPNSRELILKRFQENLSGDIKEPPEFEDESKPTGTRKRITLPPTKKAKFGGKQPPGLNINGCLCSYSTLMKAIMCAQTKPFKRAEIVAYANEIHIGLNHYSIGNGWYQIRKHKWVREAKTHGYYEITNELLLENQKFFKDLYTILPNHVQFINNNFKLATEGKLRPKVDPVIEEPAQEDIDTPEVLETKDTPEISETETPPKIEPTLQSNAAPRSDIQEIREMAIALGIIDEKPAIDPKVFIGECIVSYLEATSNGDAFKRSTSPIKTQMKPAPAPEKPIDKDEYILRLKNLSGQMQSMTTAKEKAESLARQLQTANFDLKQQKGKIESELNNLKFRNQSLLPGESDKTVKLSSVVRFK